MTVSHSPLLFNSLSYLQVPDEARMNAHQASYLISIRSILKFDSLSIQADSSYNVQIPATMYKVCYWRNYGIIIIRNLIHTGNKSDWCSPPSVLKTGFPGKFLKFPRKKLSRSCFKDWVNSKTLVLGSAPSRVHSLEFLKDFKTALLKKTCKKLLLFLSSFKFWKFVFI